MTPDQLGQRIRALRISRGLTVDDCCDRFKVCNDTWWRWERGDNLVVASVVLDALLQLAELPAKPD